MGKFTNKVKNKVVSKLQDFVRPQLERVLKASYILYVVEETKQKKNPLTTYEEYCKAIKETLERGEA